MGRRLSQLVVFNNELFLACMQLASKADFPYQMALSDLWY